MDKPNFIKASNLIFISSLLGVIGFFLRSQMSTYEIIIGIISVCFVAGIALLIRKGYQWMKWVMLILTVLGVAATVMVLPVIMRQKLIIAINSSLQTILQIIATILMFLPKKSLPEVASEYN